MKSDKDFFNSGGSHARHEHDDDESSFEDELYDFTIDELFDDSKSPGLKIGEEVDIPLIRDKHNHLCQLETIISAITNGCILGKLCLIDSKHPRKWLFNAIALTDTIVVSFQKNDILKMIEN